MQFTQPDSCGTPRKLSPLSLATAGIVSAAIFVTIAPAQADFLYTGFQNSGITRINERTGEVTSVFAKPSDGFVHFRGMALGPDGLLYVSAAKYTDPGKPGRWGIHRFNPQTGDFLGTLIQDPIDWILFGPNGSLYGVLSWTNDLVEYDRVTGASKRTVLADYVGNFVFVDDQHIFAATGFGNHKLARYDLTTGERTGPITDLRELGFEDYGFDRMALSPTGELLAPYNYRNRDTVLPGGIMRFDPVTGMLIDTLLDDLPAFGAAAGGQLGLAFDPDGHLYVGSQLAKAVLKFDPLSKAQIGEYPTGSNGASATFIQFLPVPEPSATCLVTIGLIGMRLRRRPHRGSYDSIACRVHPASLIV